MSDRRALTDTDKALYEWQMWVPDFGLAGQERLRGASVLVSRAGGVGGAAAQQLALAGVGRIVLAHAGPLRMSDLNRQVLMSHAGLGQSRVEQAARRLCEMAPGVEVDAVPENICEENVARLVAGVDLIVGSAPRFTERLLMNREAIRQGKPLVDCAMYELELQVTTIVPGRTPCLACLVPTEPPAWDRQFPVFGAVAGVAGSLGAMEAIKVLAGLGEPLLGRMLLADLRTMRFQHAKVHCRSQCSVCSHCQEGRTPTTDEH
jgi:molybdopterin/thiamine biosynthesis adenylyltransferase